MYLFLFGINFFALVSVILGADILISGKHNVIILKLILYLQPEIRYCSEQIVMMKQMIGVIPM